MIFIVQRVEEDPDYHAVVDVSLHSTEEKAKKRVLQEFNKLLDTLGRTSFAPEEDLSIPAIAQRWAEVREDGGALIHDADKDYSWEILCDTKHTLIERS